MHAYRNTGSLLLALIAAALLGGCATTANNPKDPWEGTNRVMFSVHEGIDTAVLKPVAKGYDAVTPDLVQAGIGNFFSNIDDLPVMVNDLLQGKPADAVSDLGRVVMNTTFGLLGFFDIATQAGLEKHDEDFGQTFGRWGVNSGPYVFIPVFGPRTARDSVGLVFDIYADPVGYVSNVRLRNSMIVVRAISYRAELLPADKVIDEAALDKYAYIRDAYLQSRENLVYDGSPPHSKDSDE
ncbi:MAG TPA: VacJ family lipoprotein [Rhodocyclaceae bacterium]|jgi:phospholipid-binding lipoprotein MlaA|nr:VacJ family lipoprotein [Rhodocyclaceae bacterium]